MRKYEKLFSEILHKFNTKLQFTWFIIKKSIEFRFRILPGRTLRFWRNVLFAFKVLSSKLCFEDMDNGQLPFKWQGKKSMAIETDFGFDIDTEWQYVVIEYWLKNRGFTEDNIPWSLEN